MQQAHPSSAVRAAASSGTSSDRQGSRSALRWAARLGCAMLCAVVGCGDPPAGTPPKPAGTGPQGDLLDEAAPVQIDSQTRREAPRHPSAAQVAAQGEKPAGVAAKGSGGVPVKAASFKAPATKEKEKVDPLASPGAKGAASATAGGGAKGKAASALTSADAAGLFKKYCYECHGGGADEGNLVLDKLLAKVDFKTQSGPWVAVWQNLRAQTMPPADDPQPSDRERVALLRWIERDVFRLDPASPDPGRVTIRRLNREEYQNTVLDLLGIDFNVDEAFPADDTGYGFDTIGDVLTISPLLMEKYIEAARDLVDDVLPSDKTAVPVARVNPDDFRSRDRKQTIRRAPFAKPLETIHNFYANAPGPYRITIEAQAIGADEATSHAANLTLVANDAKVFERKLGWDFDRKPIVADLKLVKGKNVLVLTLSEAAPPEKDEDPLTLSVPKIELIGPTDGSVRSLPKGYAKLFIDGGPPADLSKRPAYARKVLEKFAEKAYRRPVDAATVDRLVKLAEAAGAKEPKTFEAGVGHAAVAILASPRFLFRAEIQPEPNNPGKVQRLDEFSLASRLSYFLWSSCPDEILFNLARDGKLRAELPKQIERMLADPKAERLVQNFVGQWLQTRDVVTLNFDARRVLGIKSNEEAQKLFNFQLRRAIKQETEMFFGHILREDRPAVELLTSDYTFLNRQLADWYGVKGVDGDKMRKVQLPADSKRGGVLTQASFLLVTSNPTRTSPVKRGLFILDNLLGTPAPPPPADVPPLEAAAKGKRGMTVRELLEIHRKDALCASCHARMDPLGLSLEAYTAVGTWREKEEGRPINTDGQLITGEKFRDVLELSRIIAVERREDFHRCLTEKLLTYALGRGVEYYDAPTVERIVQQLEQNGGKMHTLVRGIVESAPFQSRRGDGAEKPTTPPKKEKPAAASKTGEKPAAKPTAAPVKGK